MTESHQAIALAALTELARAFCREDPGMEIPLLVGAIVVIARADLPAASNALIGAAIAGLQSASRPAVAA